MHKTWIATLMVTGALAGCGGGAPRAFPEANERSRSGYNTQCPNITGTFRFQGDPGSQFSLDAAALDEESETLWSTATFAAQANGRLHYTLNMTNEQLQSAAMTLRENHDERYAQWRIDALAGPDTNHPDLARALKDYFHRLGRSGPSPERSGENPRIACEDGWLSIPRRTTSRYSDGERDYSDQGVVWFTRDMQGGLLARSRFVVEKREFMVWCGDGCKGIPYYIRSEILWARFAPADAPALWRADETALPLPVSTLTKAADAERRLRAAEKAKIPVLTVIATPDPRAPALKLRVQALLRGSAELTWFEQEPRYIHVGALVDSEADARRLMDDLRRDGEVTRVEFLATAPADQKRTRINVGVYLKPML